MGDDLLHCFDIPGLPQDNLKIESLFGRLPCHQRRISGRKSTQPLRDFGHYQIRFCAESEEQLLEQLRLVPVEDFREQRKQQAQAEAPRQFLARLHRDPAKQCKFWLKAIALTFRLITLLTKPLPSNYRN